MQPSTVVIWTGSRTTSLPYWRNGAKECVVCQWLTLWWAVDGRHWSVFCMDVSFSKTAVPLWEVEYNESCWAWGRTVRRKTPLTFGILHLKTFLTTKAFLAPVFIGQKVWMLSCWKLALYHNVVPITDPFWPKCCWICKQSWKWTYFLGVSFLFFFFNMFMWCCQRTMNSDICLRWTSFSELPEQN